MLLALVLTGGFMVVEVIGGLAAGSLALLADAGHMLTDTLSLALAFVAFRIGRWPHDARRTYGYHRFQVLAAFVNGLTLVAIVGWIAIEAIRRLLEPVEVLGGLMLAVAVIGLVVNIAAFAILHGGDRRNLNLRGAALHVLADMLGSVAAIVAALVISITGWMPIDPLLSLLVVLLILRSAWFLLRRSGHILLEGAPEWLDEAELRECPGGGGAGRARGPPRARLDADRRAAPDHAACPGGAGRRPAASAARDPSHARRPLRHRARHRPDRDRRGLPAGGGEAGAGMIAQT